jgi:hypothetical protein
MFFFVIRRNTSKEYHPIPSSFPDNKNRALTAIRKMDILL